MMLRTGAQLRGLLHTSTVPYSIIEAGAALRQFVLLLFERLADRQRPDTTWSY